MNPKAGRALRLGTLLGAGLLLGTAACSRSTPPPPEYWLCAKPGGITMPDGVSVAIWGYALDAPGFAGGCAGEPTLPGPVLRVGADHGTLTVHVRNLLPEPTSLVIPGQTAAMTPVWWDADGSTVTGARTSPSQRVRSFTHEAAPGGVATYTWSDVRPGTYLYHSGTHPQVQVQMGLYGALTRDARDGGSGPRREWTPLAYDGVPYDSEVVLLFSEIDPAQHLAIANGTYGTAQGPTSTLRYAPEYFLLNGKPFTAGSAPLASVAAGSRTLLRFLNAGLQPYAPVIQGVHMQMIAEGGRPYPWAAHPREQYSTLLPALGTVDALVVPPAGGGAARYPIYDRRLNLTTGAQAEGGMLGYLSVRAP